jgi:lipoate-protein ligase A
MERWRLIIDAPRDGARNMARDEALAWAGAPPTLRLYAWQPACLSLGRFQRSGEIDRAACGRAGVAIVRRPSGGRALLHDAELTYAVIASEHHPLLGGSSILASYRQISLALLDGLRRLGVDAALTPAQRARHTVHSAPASAACFDAPASYELTVGGRKLVGSAQTRRNGMLIQHGAIPLTGHAERLSALLLRPPANLAASMVALDEAAGRAIGFDEVAAALVDGFSAAWDVEFVPGTFSASEEAAVADLQHTKYMDEGWTFGR